MTTNVTNTEEILMEPVKYYMNQPGKDIRKKICQILGNKFEISQDNIEKVDSFINTVHNASLVIDDIQDGSTLRRNIECAHIKYGSNISLNSGYLSIFKALLNVFTDNNVKERTKNKMVTNMYNIQLGQSLDVYYTQHKYIPTIDEYNSMIEYKTGMVFICIIDLLIDTKIDNAAIQPQYNFVSNTLLKFSRFFQIRDDYINVTDITYWQEKGFCQDFDEQKTSYLITYCTNNKLDRYEEINALLQKPKKSNKLKRELLLLMNNNGLLDIIYNQLFDLKNEILELTELNDIFQHLPICKFNINDVNEYLRRKRRKKT